MMKFERQLELLRNDPVLQKEFYYYSKEYLKIRDIHNPDIEHQRVLFKGLDLDNINSNKRLYTILKKNKNLEGKKMDLDMYSEIANYMESKFKGVSIQCINWKK